MEAVLGVPVDESSLTEQVLLDLVAAGTRESDQLEFKRDPYPAAPRDAKIPWLKEQEFAKDVTALANHIGGVLIIGVDESAGAASEVVASVSEPIKEIQRLRSALHTYAVPIPRAIFVPIKAAQSDGYYLVVVVPPSPLAPHAVAGQRHDGRRPLHWFVRDGDQTRSIGESEVAERYSARMRGVAERSSRRDRIAAEGQEALQNTELVWLWMATVPEAPVPTRLDATAVSDATQWWRREYGFGSPLARNLYANGQPLAGPGKTTFTGRTQGPDQDASEIRGTYVELHVDGSAFAATPVELNTGNTGGIGEVTLMDDMILVADACLSWTLRQAGSWGTADVVCGLYDAAGQDGRPSHALELVEDVDGTIRRLPGTRRVERSPMATTTADLAACATVRGRLAAAAAAAGSLLQWFGPPEPAQVGLDGTVRPFEWGMSRRREVTEWASRWDIPCSNEPHPHPW